MKKENTIKDLNNYSQLFGQIKLLIQQQAGNMDDPSRKMLQKLVSKFSTTSDSLLGHLQDISQSRRDTIVSLKARTSLFAYEAKRGYLPKSPAKQGRKEIQASVESARQRPAHRIASLGSAPESSATLDLKPQHSASSSDVSSESQSASSSAQPVLFTLKSTAPAEKSSSSTDVKSEASSSSDDSGQSGQDPEKFQSMAKSAEAEAKKNRSLKAELESYQSSSSDSVKSAKAKASSAPSSEDEEVHFKTYSDGTAPTARGGMKSAPNFSVTINNAPENSTAPSASASSQSSEQPTAPKAPRPPKATIPPKQKREPVRQRKMPHKRRMTIKQPDLNAGFTDNQTKSQSNTEDSSVQKNASRRRPKSSQDGHQTSVGQSTQTSKKVNSADLAKIADGLFGDAPSSSSESSSASASSSASSGREPSASSASSSSVSDVPGVSSNKSSSSNWDPTSYMKMKGNHEPIGISKTLRKKRDKEDEVRLANNMKRYLKNDTDAVEPNHKFAIQQRQMRKLSGNEVDKVVMYLFHQIADGSMPRKPVGLSISDTQLVYHYYYGVIVKKTDKFTTTPEDRKRIRQILAQLAQYAKKHPELNDEIK